MDLFDDTETHQLTINEHYAAAYAARKEREELAQRMDKYADSDDDGEGGSDSDETEDEDGVELTPAMDVAILKTLSRIRKADPSIYETDKNVFQEEEQRLSKHTEKKTLPSPKARDKSKSITLRDMALEELLNPVDEDALPLTHAEEQAHLREETIAAFHTIKSDNDEDEDDILVLRERPERKEEEAYKQFLLAEVGEEDVKEALRLTPVLAAYAEEQKPTGDRKTLQKRSAKDEKSSDDEFLTNYILNRGWMDHSQRHTPTYQEVVSIHTSGKSLNADDLVDVEEDEDFEDINDRFESSYNFRFEEPNGAVIPTHPRTIASTVRRQDDSRKQLRERRKARKEAEKVTKQEELKRLKALKRREIEEKLKLLGQVSGKTDIQSEQIDLDGDFEPETYDKQMQAVFDEDNYYGQIEDEKPSWDDDIIANEFQVEDFSDNYSGQSASDMAGPSGEDRQVKSESSARKRKLDQYMDEYFSLDHSDMVGDLPTRFKYMPVPPSSYSLTPAEILLATDAELNAYMGVKKYAPYREGQPEKGRSKRLWELRETLRGRSWTNEKGQDTPDAPRKKRKGKRERMRGKLTATHTVEP